MKPFIPGLIIIFVGIVLFWASTRRTVSEGGRRFLEGQATIAIPAGLAALGVGAWQKSKGQNGADGKDDEGTPRDASRGDPEKRG